MNKIDKIKELIKQFCPESNISSEKMREWCETIDKNYSKFKKKDWDGIYQVLVSFGIEGVDDQIIQRSASAIADAEEADMNIDRGVATVFFLYAMKCMKKC